MIQQKTFDILDSELRRSYNKYLNYSYDDRYKLLTHEWRIDPYWSGTKFKEISRYNLSWSPPYKYSAQPNIDSIISTSDTGIYIFFVRPPDVILDMPKYVIYVGISGERGSSRPLKERLNDYYYISKLRLRKGIHKALQLYYEEAYFSFAFYNGADIETLETLLHEYFSPKWASRDYEPPTKAAKSAWGKI